MRLISTTHPHRLHRARRRIRCDLPSSAVVPDTRLVSEIDFHYRHRRLFGWLDLCYPATLKLDGRRWRNLSLCLESTELWLLRDPEDQPSVALARMQCLLEARYKQHPHLRCWLFSTVGIPLRYDRAEDAFWGCGSTGGGLNHLGNLHMDYRERHTPWQFRKLMQPFTFRSHDPAR